jgi:site-specific recombinase XerD
MSLTQDKENQKHLRQIDLRSHDLWHEGACRLPADGVDIRIIQLILGHASFTTFFCPAAPRERDQAVA